MKDFPLKIEKVSFENILLSPYRQIHIHIELLLNLYFP
jgi:hypothetical protein